MILAPILKYVWYSHHLGLDLTWRVRSCTVWSGTRRAMSSTDTFPEIGERDDTHPSANWANSTEDMSTTVMILLQTLFYTTGIKEWRRSACLGSPWTSRTRTQAGWLSGGKSTVITVGLDQYLIHRHLNLGSTGRYRHVVIENMANDNK